MCPSSGQAGSRTSLDPQCLAPAQPQATSGQPKEVPPARRVMGEGHGGGPGTYTSAFRRSLNSSHTDLTLTTPQHLRGWGGGTSYSPSSVLPAPRRDGDPRAEQRQTSALSFCFKPAATATG